MKPLPPSLVAAALAMAAPFAAVAADPPATPAAPVVVHVKSAARIVAPSWDPAREYKYGEFVSYDGFAFKAKTGSAHRRPNANSEVGWEVMNACDDASSKAIECEEENQSAVTDATKQANKQFNRALDGADLVRHGER